MSIIIMQGTTMAGKTEHGKRLAAHIGYDYVSSGDIARSLMDVHTRDKFKDGKLSPHDEAIRSAIYRKVWFCLNIGRGIVLDGFPRTAAHVVDFLNQAFDTKPIVLSLDVTLDAVLQRGAVRGRDEFDTQDVILKRHAVYLRETLPALDWMAQFFGEHVVIKVDPTHTPEQTFEKITAALSRWELV